MRACGQLALPFTETEEYSEADFLDDPANREAQAWLARPLDWPGGRLCLWGESGVGKSHLLHLWARHTGALIQRGRTLSEAIAPPLGAIALDDADLAPEDRLLHLLNSAREAGLSLLMAAPAAPARWPVSLPDLASRLAATAAVSVGPPADALREVLFARLLSARQLVLAPPLIAWLLTRLPRHPAALAEAAARLDRAGLAAGRPLSRQLAASALLPLLMAEPDEAPPASPSGTPLL
ncbi:MAG: chromosomal replication initiator DnaA [Acetobacteraceae bacterium]